MKTFLCSLFLFASLSLFAQYDDYEKPFHFGVGGAVSLPLSDLKTSSNYGVGVEIQPSYALSENIEAFLQAGLHVFSRKTGYGEEESGILHIPVLVGARFKASGFFAGAGVGYGMFNGGDESLKGFMYSPQIGYDFGSYEIGANYTATKVTGGTLSYAGIKAFRKF